MDTDRAWSKGCLPSRNVFEHGSKAHIAFEEGFAFDSPGVYWKKPSPFKELSTLPELKLRCASQRQVGRFLMSG